MRRVARARGFTLLELLVVLVLMGLAAGLVVPALLRAARGRPTFASLLPTARAEAARRGEMIHLRIEPSGQWRMDGATTSALDPTAPLATGRIAPIAGAPLTLLVSPLGSCAFDVSSAVAARGIPLDPLACELVAPTRAAHPPRATSSS